MKLLRSLACTATLLTGHAATAAGFHDHLGLQLWSLRDQAKSSATGALDLAAGFGFTEVETAGTWGLPTGQFAAELAARKLSAVSAHTGYEALKADLATAIRDAKTLGVKYLICPILPHGQDGLTVADAHRVAAEFNAWGEACRAAGLRFGYHPHGIEFVAGPAGETPFDILMRETQPELVCFELDVFWAFHAGQDPVKLLRQHPGRWRLLHVKDIRRGAATGFATGSAPVTDKVAVGTGQIDWPAVLGAAAQAGVEYYFIEDEGPQPLTDIPASLRYLKTLKP
jgi:sugar phosphate isomerase/epimerase